MDTSTPLSFVKVIGQITDPYERQARLFPALIAISPFLVMIFGLYQDQLSKFHTLVVAILSCGGLFLLSELARRRGKMKEKSLWASWGGAPSVQVLRYANDTFDDVSTSRYHSILSKKIGVKFPSQHEERSNPCEADKIYASAGNYLRNATRDKGKFNLLFRDNISYGFRRNGYGLKWIGVTICFLCLIWVFVRGNINTFSLRLYSGNGIESVLLPGEWITVGMSLIMLVVWLLLFTESAVREAGFSYAERLILACEVLPKAKNAKVQTNKKISPTENT